MGPNPGAEADPSSDLYARAQGRISEVARRAVAQVAVEVPFYGMLPREVLEGELTDYVMAHVRLFLRAVREGRQPTDEELAEPLTAGVRRAQEGVPLSAMLAAYLAASREAWAAIVDIAHDDELQEVLAAGFHTFRYMEVLLPAVSAVYLEERQTIYGEEREARRALVTALLTGQPGDALAQRALVKLAKGYVVLTLGFESETAGEGGDITAGVAGRRLTRSAQEVLDRELGGQVLTALDSSGGVVLVPLGDADPAVLIARLGEVVAAVSTASASSVTAAAAVAESLPGVPDAASVAREVAMIARHLRRPPGLYVLDDVLMEYQLTRPGPARDRLAHRLDPLEGQEHLLAALHAFFARDHNTRLAAEDLHVHTNTLQYRLRRVGEITGLDPTKPSEARLLSAAILADLLAQEG